MKLLASTLAILAVAASVLSPALAAKRERLVQPRAHWVDNVGSIAYDGRGFAVNRRTGERYHGCVIDEGYGRVSSCDAGTNR